MGKVVEGELEFGLGEPGSQAVVLARAEGQGEFGRGANRSPGKAAGSRLAEARSVVTRVSGPDCHAAEVGVFGGCEYAAACPVVEGDPVDDSLGEEGCGFGSLPSRVQVCGCSLSR